MLIFCLFSPPEKDKIGSLLFKRQQAESKEEVVRSGRACRFASISLPICTYRPADLYLSAY